MSRSKRHFGETVRSSIGDSHVESAVTTVKLLAQKHVTMMTEYRHTREATLPMLFDDDVLEKMSQVRGMVTPSSSVESYAIPGTDANMSINYEGALCPTIDDGMLRLNPERAAPLLAYIRQVQAMHYQFEDIKGVLRWLNRNATLGAIRYNWPTALKLCPNSPLKDMEGVPSRFNNPTGISEWLQVIKDSATVFAGTLLHPSNLVVRPRGSMWLTFPSKTVKVGVADAYTSDALTYHI